MSEQPEMSEFFRNDPNEVANMAKDGGVSVAEIIVTRDWENGPGITDEMRLKASQLRMEMNLITNKEKYTESQIKDAVLGKDKEVKEEGKKTDEEKKEGTKPADGRVWVARNNVWVKIDMAEIRPGEMPTTFLEGEEPEVGDSAGTVVEDEDAPSGRQEAPEQGQEPVPPVQNEVNNADQILNAYLDLGLDQNKNKQFVEKWLQENVHKASPEALERAKRIINERNAEVVDIPTDREQYIKFIRPKIRDAIRLANNDGQLSVGAIESALTLKLSQEIGMDLTRGGRIELFPRGLDSEVRFEVEAEIEARANLRNLQLKEEGYKAQGDKAAALNRYISDMKGSESGGASPSIVSRETYDWLKKLDDCGDPEGVTTEKVDRAFAILLKLGEKDPEFNSPWERGFERFRQEGDPNIYDPGYNINRRAEAFDMIGRRFGQDARDLAYQLFQAYKEEGNYNWNYYLSGLFQFANGRAALAGLDIPVFSGSDRVYATGGEPGHTSYKDEIKYLALSPLRIPGKLGEIPDPKPDKADNMKDVKEDGLYFRRAIRGKFLQETGLVDPKQVKINPEVEVYNAIKTAEKIRKAISDIGTLNQEADKVGAMGKAVGYLVEIRDSGQSLVNLGVIKQEDLDKQILFEAENVIYELSVDNSSNVSNLPLQTRDKTNFLSPSKLNELFVRLGNPAKNSGHRIVDSPEGFEYLKEKLQEVKFKTIAVLRLDEKEGGMKYGEKDSDLLQTETDAVDFVDLPEIPGQNFVRRDHKVALKIHNVLFSPNEWLRKKALVKLPGAIGRYWQNKRFK